MKKNPLKVISVGSPYAKRVVGEAHRSFGPNGNLTGMRENFGWDRAYPVKIGAYVYDVPPELYNMI